MKCPYLISPRAAEHAHVSHSKKIHTHNYYIYIPLNLDASLEAAVFIRTMYIYVRAREK